MRRAQRCFLTMSTSDTARLTLRQAMQPTPLTMTHRPSLNTDRSRECLSLYAAGNAPIVVNAKALIVLEG